MLSTVFGTEYVFNNSYWVNITHKVSHVFVPIRYFAHITFVFQNNLMTDNEIPIFTVVETKAWAVKWPC